MSFGSTNGALRASGCGHQSTIVCFDNMVKPFIHNGLLCVTTIIPYSMKELPLLDYYIITACHVYGELLIIPVISSIANVVDCCHSCVPFLFQFQGWSDFLCPHPSPST